MSHKTVAPLSDGDREQLERLVKEDPSARVRQRAEAILLSGKGYSIKQISEIKGKRVITVSRWIGQWEERGVDGILEGEGRGRKGILTEEERQEVCKWLEEESPPRSAAELAARIQKTSRECRAVESETCSDRFQLPPRHYFALRAACAVPARLEAPSGFFARR